METITKFRPSFDQYFLTLAFVVSLRSEDPDTKHGAVIVTKKDNLILATGYNALIRGAKPGDLPTTRPEKYPFFIHSEENALLNLSRSIRDYPGGAKIYITGKPCLNCLQRVWNAGIDEIIMAKRQGTKLETPETNTFFDKIIQITGIKLREMEINNDWLLQLFPVNCPDRVDCTGGTIWSKTDYKIEYPVQFIDGDKMSENRDITPWS